MGYDLHITRADFWAINEGTWITREEWLAAVRGDAELQLMDDVEPCPAEWLGDPSGHSFCFEWNEGNVVVKDPTDAAIRKMRDIASRLGGKVQGDDGELYEDAEGRSGIRSP